VVVVVAGLLVRNSWDEWGPIEGERRKELRFINKVMMDAYDDDDGDDDD